MTNADLPAILIKGQSQSAGQELTNMLGVVLAATSHAASLTKLVDEDLLRHLHRKLHDSYEGARALFWAGCAIV